MNPNSKEAVAGRAAQHRKAIAHRDRLAREGEQDSSPAAVAAFERAQSDVRAGLSRMEAMGDPLPGEAPARSSSQESGAHFAPVSPVSPPPSATPLAAAEATPTRDPVEDVVARIFRA